MATTKVKKLKLKTHKATAKRFRVTPRGKVIHEVQGAGGGQDSMANKRRSQRKARRGSSSLGARGERRKVIRLIG